jgi:MinD-like ATPase involved in chromosome partitioning or flagellar assembly
VPRIAQEARNAAADGIPYVCIVAGASPTLHAWASVQASQGRPVLIATSESLPTGDPIARTKVVRLPATVDEVMGVFGAPPAKGHSGSAIILADGRVQPEPIPVEDGYSEPTYDDPDDPFSQPMFGAAPEPPQTSSPFGAAPEPPQTSSPFGAAPEPPQPPPPPQVPTPIPAQPHQNIESAFRPIVTPGLEAGSHRSPVIVVFAGKGGVGKTTTAIAIGERAASSGVRRVVVVDANRGQGDARTHLRVSRPLPSIYDAAISGDIGRALIGPQRLHDARTGLEELHIGVILAPTSDQADPSIVTTEVYRAAVEHARSIADLVVVDTQIVEATDTSGLIDGLVVPLLNGDGWGVGITDSSMAGVSNLVLRLRAFQARGVSTARILVALNRMSPESGIDPSAIEEMMSKFGSWAGAVRENPEISKGVESGRIGIGSDSTTEWEAMLDRVLYRVTGLDAFAGHSRLTTAPTDGRKPKSGRLRWRR